MTFHPDTPPEYRNAIVTGDARELAKRVPDESVDLIFTDPVYWQIEDYGWLAETAARVLREGGSVVAQVGTHFRYDAEAAMRASNLQPCPLLCEVLNSGLQQNWKHRSLIAWKPYIWMSKGTRKGGAWILDRTLGGGANKLTHNWGDSPPAFVTWIATFTERGAVILDPFTGGGTVPAVCKMLGRNYIAFEIDPATAERARERVQNTQPPLPGLVVEQMGMSL